LTGDPRANEVRHECERRSSRIFRASGHSPGEQLDAQGFDVTLTGFTESDLAALLDTRTAGRTDPDDAPPKPATPTTQLGDLFRLGRHRLICGDATDARTVARLLANDSPNLMVTDPPYGVDYDPEWRNRAARHSFGMGNRMIGAGAVGRVTNDDRADWREAWDHFTGDVVYARHGGLRAGEAAEALEQSGFAIRAQIIWAKNHFAIGRGDYNWQHEPCYYAVRRGRPGGFVGDHAKHIVGDRQARFVRDRPLGAEAGRMHDRPMQNSPHPGDHVYDPFVGSGTTIIAAEMTVRKALTIEIDPSYCDVAILRWQAFTGETATRDDGAPFDELQREQQQAESTQRKIDTKLPRCGSMCETRSNMGMHV